MPVIVPESEYPTWLDTSSTPDELTSILTPFESDNIVLYPVSRLVNNPANNYEDLLMPVSAQ
jgi:putative SOS response-associated peptidase YedK